MTDRNRELVPDNWSLVRERALTTGLCSEGWYSEHSGVCRRAELPGRSVKKKCFVTTINIIIIIIINVITNEQCSDHSGDDIVSY